jgi:hypothetical protein
VPGALVAARERRETAPPTEPPLTPSDAPAAAGEAPTADLPPDPAPGADSIAAQATIF